MSKKCYKVTGVTVSTTEIALNTAIQNISICNGQNVCICLKDVDFPASTTVLPVFIQINGTNVPLLDSIGNTLFSDQIKCIKCLPGVWGTNPLHIKVCSPRPRSQAAALSVTPGA